MALESSSQVTVVISLHLFRRLPSLFGCCWYAWSVSTSFLMRATCQVACVFIYIKTIVPVPVLLFLTVPCADLHPTWFGLIRDASTSSLSSHKKNPFFSYIYHFSLGASNHPPSACTHPSKSYNFF